MLQCDVCGGDICAEVDLSDTNRNAGNSVIVCAAFAMATSIVSFVATGTKSYGYTFRYFRIAVFIGCGMPALLTFIGAGIYSSMAQFTSGMYARLSFVMIAGRSYRTLIVMCHLLCGWDG